MRDDSIEILSCITKCWLFELEINKNVCIFFFFNTTLFTQPLLKMIVLQKKNGISEAKHQKLHLNYILIL